MWLATAAPLCALLFLAAACAIPRGKAQPVPDSYSAAGVPLRAKKKDLKAGVGASGPKRIDPAECYLSNKMFRENLAAVRSDPSLRHKKNPTLIASEEGFCDLLNSKAQGEREFKDAGTFSDWCATASGPLCTRECFALANLFDLSHPQVPHRLETDDCVGCLVDDDCSAKALRDSAFHPGQGVLTLEPVDVRVDKVFVSDAVDANMYPDGGALPNVETLQRRSPQTTDTFLRKDPREYPKKL